MTTGEHTEFKTMRVLIVSAKPHVVQVMRYVFAVLDVLHVSVAVTAKAGLERLCANRYSAVFCDESCGEIGGESFARVARRHPSATNAMVPLFLLCASVRRRDVERARDSGYSDVLVRPVSAATVQRKLRQASENPRPFIAAPDFFGPDRRAKRRHQFHGEERRKRNARKIKVAAECIVEL